MVYHKAIDRTTSGKCDQSPALRAMPEMIQAMQAKYAALGLVGKQHPGRPGGQRRQPQRRWSQRVRCVETGRVYRSVQEATEAHGLRSRNAIVGACRRGWVAAGYHWKLVGKKAMAASA
jgi:hypothetical protein